MRTLKLIALLGIFVLSLSCVLSIHPLYTEKDLIAEPKLEGTWTDKEGKELWTFEKAGEKSYKLTVVQKEKSGESSEKSGAEESVKFDAHLVKLGNYVFMDLYPQEPEIKNDFYKWHLLPVHSFSRIWIEQDIVKISMLSIDWFKKMIEKKKIKIAYEKIDNDENRFVLTAPTEKLQKFILKYAEDSEAFPEPAELYRQK